MAVKIAEIGIPSIDKPEVGINDDGNYTPDGEFEFGFVSEESGIV